MGPQQRAGASRPCSPTSRAACRRSWPSWAGGLFPDISSTKRQHLPFDLRRRFRCRLHCCICHATSRPSASLRPASHQKGNSSGFSDVSHIVPHNVDMCLADKLILVGLDAKTLTAVAAVTPRKGTPQYCDLMCDIYRSVFSVIALTFLGLKFLCPQI
jgi:hypothetical protein